MSFQLNGNNPLNAGNMLPPGSQAASRIISKIVATVVGVGLILIGAFFFSAMGASEKDYDKLSTTGGKAVASVTNIKQETETKKSGSNNTRKTTNYENKTLTYKVDGKDFTIKDRDVKTSTPAKIGDQQNVFYDKTNPSKSVLEGSTTKGTGFKLIPIIFMAFGALLAFGGIFSLIRRRVFGQP